MNLNTPTEEVRAWLENLPIEKKPTVERLRRLIGSVAPEAHEIIYHDALGYGPTESGFDRILYVTVFAKHLNLGFFFCGFLPDPEGDPHFTPDRASPFVCGTGCRDDSDEVRA